MPLRPQTALAAACALALVGIASMAHSRSSGITAFEMINGPATCSGNGNACHSQFGPSDEVFVTIDGPDSLAFGETATYTVSIHEAVPGALTSQQGAGINVSLFVGGLYSVLDEAALVDDNTQILSQGGATDLTHLANANQSGPPTGSVGDFSYDFRVSGPESETTLTVMAALNAFDQSFTNSGDKWNRAELEITVPEPALAWQTCAALAALAGLARRPRAPGERARSGSRSSH